MKTPFFSDKTYQFLRFLAQVALPAAATLYFALSEIWKLPHGAEVVGTMTAIDTFLGVLLGISTKAYKQVGLKYDGAIVIQEEDDKKVFTLDFGDEDPDKIISNKKEVLFVVGKDKK